MHVLSVLVASFKFNFSAKLLQISVESDPLSRKILVVSVLKPFEMVTGMSCKVCDLTECEIVVAWMYFEDSEIFHRAMCGAIVYSYLSYIESVKHNFEKNGF